MGAFTLTDIHAEDAAGRTSPRNSPPSERVAAAVLRLLSDNVLCSMATVGADGGPHINVAYFSYTDILDLYFLSHPASAHCRNLAGRPSMAIAVFSPVQNWLEPDLGVQLFGTCGQAHGPAVAEAERSYAARFEAYAKWRTGLEEGDPARQYKFYRFRAAAVKILDEKTLGDGVFVRARVQRE